MPEKVPPEQKEFFPKVPDAYYWKISIKDYWDFNHGFVLRRQKYLILNIVVKTEEICWLWQEGISKLLSFASKDEKWYYTPVKILKILWARERNT